MKTLLIALIAFSVVGCSARAVYENLQLNRQQECLEVSPQRYDECMKGMDKSYDEYERERQEYLKEREQIDQSR